MITTTRKSGARLRYNSITLQMTCLRIAAVAVVLAAPALQVSIPTPDKAPWEMPFVEVEELAGLPSLVGASRDVPEVRVMQRPVTSQGKS
jgi:hypothetical protein